MGQNESYQSVVRQLANRAADLYYANKVLPQQLSVDELPNAFRDDWTVAPLYAPTTPTSRGAAFSMS